MRVDTDDFARPRGCGKNHLVEVEKILIEPGAVTQIPVRQQKKSWKIFMTDVRSWCWMRMI